MTELERLLREAIGKNDGHDQAEALAAKPMPLEALCLTVRTMNVLRGAGLESIDDILNLSNDDARKIKGLTSLVMWELLSEVLRRNRSGLNNLWTTHSLSIERREKLIREVTPVILTLMPKLQELERLNRNS